MSKRRGYHPFGRAYLLSRFEHAWTILRAMISERFRTLGSISGTRIAMIQESMIGQEKATINDQNQRNNLVLRMSRCCTDCLEARDKHLVY